MSSLSKEQLRARLKLNQRLALSQGSGERKPTPYFWRLRPVRHKSGATVEENIIDQVEPTTVSSYSKGTPNMKTETWDSVSLPFETTEQQVDLMTHFPKRRSMEKKDSVQVTVPESGSHLASTPTMTREPVVDVRTDRNSESSTLRQSDLSKADVCCQTISCSHEWTTLEEEKNRLFELLNQKTEQLKQKDTEIAYLRQVLSEIATSAHLAVNLESNYALPGAFYSAEDTKTLKTADKTSSWRRGAPSVVLSDGNTLYSSAHSHLIDGHVTCVSNSYETKKENDASMEDTQKDHKFKLSLAVDSLGLSGSDVTNSKHRGAPIVHESTNTTIPTTQVDRQSNIEEEDNTSNDLVPPSPRLSRLKMNDFDR
eukprot:jgi/Galph1/5771/GphlegSOOS_G4366.1